MKKVKIDRVTVLNWNKKLESKEYDDWYVEVDHWKKLEPALNDIRENLKKKFRKKYKDNVKIMLIYTEL